MKSQIHYIRTHWNLAAGKTWQQALQDDISAIRAGRIHPRLHLRIINGSLFERFTRRPARRNRPARKTRVPDHCLSPVETATA